jgi:hypothetical protein
MYAQAHLFHTHGHKVFVDSQKSRIKCNYYIKMSLKTKKTLTKQNSGRLQNTTGIATRAAQSLELLVKEFQSIFTFCAVGLYSREK